MPTESEVARLMAIWVTLGRNDIFQEVSAGNLGGTLNAVGIDQKITDQSARDDLVGLFAPGDATTPTGPLFWIAQAVENEVDKMWGDPICPVNEGVTRGFDAMLQSFGMATTGLNPGTVVPVQVTQSRVARLAAIWVTCSRGDILAEVAAGNLTGELNAAGIEGDLVGTERENYEGMFVSAAPAGVLYNAALAVETEVDRMWSGDKCPPNGNITPMYNALKSAYGF